MRKDSVEYVVHLGDYIYEYANGEYGWGDSVSFSALYRFLHSIDTDVGHYSMAAFRCQIGISTRKLNQVQGGGNLLMRTVDCTTIESALPLTEQTWTSLPAIKSSPGSRYGMITVCDALLGRT